MKRWRIPLAGLVAAGVAAAVVWVVVPEAEAASDTLAPIARSYLPSYRLEYHDLTGTPAFRNLMAGQQTYGPTTVVDDPKNQSMKGCDSRASKALPSAPKHSAALCWADGDQATTFWNPQGITTSGDADNDGRWGDRRMILSGWQVRDRKHPRYNDARIAFIDADSKRYRWAYLIEAVNSSDGRMFRRAESHVGGLIWYGDKLITTGAGSQTLKVFDLRRIMVVSTADDKRIGQYAGKRYAYGYKYVIPQIGYYKNLNSKPCGSGVVAEQRNRVCPSSLSMDRSTAGAPSMVTTEYHQDGSPGRLLRYRFGANYLLDHGSDRIADAAQAYVTRSGNMQGVLSWKGTWWTASSRGPNPGWLHANRQDHLRTASCSAQTCWSRRPQGMAHGMTPRSSSSAEIWTQTEEEHYRVVFAVPLNSMPQPRKA